MNIPKEIFIRGNLWKIQYKWRLTMDGKPVDGYIDPASKTIFITHGLSKDDKEEIFFHEFFHAVMAEVGLYHTSLNSDVEETICHNASVELRKNFCFRKKRQKFS